MNKNVIVCLFSFSLTTLSFAENVLTDWVNVGNGRDESFKSAIVDNIEWRYTVENGSAIIGRNIPMGSGFIDLISAVPQKTVGEIIIPTELGGFPVIAIGDLAFQGCSDLTSITIPEGVTSIGDFAFRSCSGLMSATIPEGVTSIGKDPFSDCFRLMRIDVAEENPIYMSIDGILFNKAMSHVIKYPSGGKEGAFVIPESVTSIASGAFWGCSGLTSITIPEGVTSLWYATFRGCSGLTSVTIPEGVTSIWNGVFEDCSGLTSITIPDSVTTIGDGAFRGCSGLTSITIPNSATSIEDDAFVASIDISKDDWIEIGGIGVEEGIRVEGLGSIFDTALTLTSIGGDAFSGCSGLTSITIPESVTTIGDGAFRGCSGLTKLTIPKGITSIGYRAFRGCFSLTTLIFEGHAPMQVGEMAFEASPDLVIYYHEGTTGWTNPWQGVKTQMIKKN